jgi:hypothetical protein
MASASAVTGSPDPLRVGGLDPNRRRFDVLATAERPELGPCRPSAEYPEPGVDPFDPPEEDDLDDDDDLLSDDPEELPGEDWELEPDDDPLSSP